jgi:hypothetical protein
MNKAKSLFGALALTGVIASTAQAGSVYQPEVSISTTSRSAYGSTLAARRSTDSSMYIECGVQSNAGTAPQAVCYAANASSGGMVMCGSSDASIVAAAQASSSYSYLAFTWDASGKCTSITVKNGSHYLP